MRSEKNFLLLFLLQLLNKLPDVPAVQVPKESVEKPLIQPDFKMNLPELSSDSPMQQMRIHHLQKPHGN